MSVNLVIVGCGAVIQRIYKGPLERIQKQGDLIVRGLVDSDIGNAEKVKATFSEAQVFRDLDRALATVRADLTIVASPATFHAEHVIKALRRGSHVLCEKPLALTVEECAQMVDAASSYELLLGVEMTRRFYPSLARLRTMIENGELGSPLCFSYREGGIYNWPVMSAASFQRETGGGGVLVDKGSHVLDTMLSLFGPFSVISYQDDAMTGGVEGTCLIQIQNEMVQGMIQLSWDQELNNEFIVQGSDIEVRLDPDCLDDIRVGRSGQLRRLNPEISFPSNAAAPAVTRRTPKTYEECIYFQLVQVLRAIRLNEPLPVTGEEGAQITSAIKECYRIAEPLDMPWLVNEEEETYRRLYWRRSQ